MQIKSNFSTKVKPEVVESYLTNYYRSQDYRVKRNEHKLTVIPFNIFNPFSERNKAVNYHSLEYLLEHKGDVTEIEFHYNISFMHKMLGFVLPFCLAGCLYLLLKLILGGSIIFSVIMFGLILLLLIGYSYYQAKNFVSHITAKNIKLLQEMELFAVDHVKSGLLSQSFELN